MTMSERGYRREQGGTLTIIDVAAYDRSDWQRTDEVVSLAGWPDHLARVYLTGGGVEVLLPERERAMTETKPESYHEGRPIFRQMPEGMGVLCPVGHVYTFQPRGEWAGSMLEALATDPTWTVRCYGTMPPIGDAS